MPLLRRYLRVIPASEPWELSQVEAFLQTRPELASYRPPEPHPRGGFALYLEFPAEQAEAVLLDLHAQGLLPCL